MDEFQNTVWEYYHANMREMPWRDNPSFYNVLVSEMMLQQTQVRRVTSKFIGFTAIYPTIAALADASLAEVLQAWQGLGYNRRAKYLHDAARVIQSSNIPTAMEDLTVLPGVGHNTAAAIMNYAYNIPTPFVETNIRTVYFHHFFQGQVGVADRAILQLVELTMSRDNPREWFWALMDYGAFLKSLGAAQLSTSRHYKKQSKFEGSVRQVRGRIVTALAGSYLSEQQLRGAVRAENTLYDAALAGLIQDGLVQGTAKQYHLTK